MRILCIYKHYSPDVTPYARLLKAIAEHLAADGHEVTVYSAQPCYNDVAALACPNDEVVCGVRILRAPLPRERKTNFLLRLLVYTLYLGQAVWHAVWHRRQYDLVLFNVHPAILMGVAGRLIRLTTGLAYVMHCQDIHPEAARQSGKIRQPWLYRLLRRIDTATCQNAELNVVLSDDMRQTLLDRGVDDRKIAVQNNFSLQETQPPGHNKAVSLPEEFDDKFIVLFAGNVGHFQGLDHVIEAALLLRDNEDIRFVFMGDGAAKKQLQQQAAPAIGKTMFFLPYQPLEVACEAMRQAGAGLVPLQEGNIRLMYPSKTMTYLAEGCPLVAIVDQDSELAATVRKKELGYTCRPSDGAAIAKLIATAWREKANWTLDRRERLRLAGERLFGRAQALAWWSALIERLDGRSAVSPAAPSRRAA